MLMIFFDKQTAKKTEGAKVEGLFLSAVEWINCKLKELEYKSMSKLYNIFPGTTTSNNNCTRLSRVTLRTMNSLACVYTHTLAFYVFTRANTTNGTHTHIFRAHNISAYLHKIKASMQCMRTTTEICSAKLHAMKHSGTSCTSYKHCFIISQT